MAKFHDRRVPPGTVVGQEKPLEPGRNYPDSSKHLKAYETRAGLRWFPVGADGKPTVVKIDDVVDEKRVQLRPHGVNPFPTYGTHGPVLGALESLVTKHPDEWDKIERLMARGESSSKIVGQLQSDGLLTEYPRSTVIGTLERYRRKEFRRRQRLALEANKGDPEKIAARISIVDTMERVVLRQQARVEKAAALEGNHPMLTGMMSKESDRFVDYLGKLGNLYFETGIMARAPKIMRGVIASQETAGSDVIRSSRVVAFELTEEELPLIEGIKNELGEWMVPAV